MKESKYWRNSAEHLEETVNPLHLLSFTSQLEEVFWLASLDTVKGQTFSALRLKNHG